jgi:hypothetical protein
MAIKFLECAEQVATRCDHNIKSIHLPQVGASTDLLFFSDHVARVPPWQTSFL